MSEKKIWVEKMPESCSKCLFCYDNRPYWKSTDCIINHKELDEDEIEIKREKDCSLVDIKDHDRELVRQVCEKIREHLSEQKKSLKDTFSPYSNGKAFIISAVEESLNKIEKEFEK